MQRRMFLKGLIGGPLLAMLWPRHAQAQASAPGYSDDIGTVDLAPVHDSDLTSGIEYQP